MSNHYRIHEFAAAHWTDGLNRPAMGARRPKQEMVEDLMAIVHTFSCRLYRMRKYKQDIKKDFPEYKLAPPKEELQ